MTAVRLLYSSADEQGKEHHSSAAPATAPRQLADGRGETMVDASASGRARGRSGACYGQRPSLRSKSRRHRAGRVLSWGKSPSL